MRNQRGITLVALVITILVMIVLSTVTIAFTLGENGIFSGMRTGKYMNKVQALDDSIKAYTLKSNNAYSSSKKSLDDLVSEGILKKITLTGAKSDSEDDDKYLYYVNFENPDISVADILGLKAKEYENEEKLTNFKYKELSDLQDKGIYVVDVDLNAAYLKNQKTYGKLSNFGGADKKKNASEFESQLIKLSVNPKEVVQSHEVVMVIDRTVSMALCNDPNDPAVANVADKDEDIPILYNSDGSINYTAGYQQTRWYSTVTAMDQFMDTYFGNTPSTDRKVTIITFYGTKNDNGIQVIGTYTNKDEAKSSYSTIFSEAQYTNMVKTIIDTYKRYASRYSMRYAISYTNSDLRTNDYFSISSRGTYQINCRLANRQYTRLYSEITPASLNYSTCAPNALNYAYNYIQKTDTNMPTDVIIMTDGDSNDYWWPCTNTTTSIGNVAKNIMQIVKGDHPTDVYAVGLGKEAKSFPQYFNENIKGAYTADNATELINAFKAIAESIKINQDAMTDADNSHSIMTRDTTTGELKELELENVNKVVLELENTETGEKRTMTFQRNGNGSGGIYNLDAIYNKDNKQITLENAWVYSGLSSTELTLKYNKTVIVYTD